MNLTILHTNDLHGSLDSTMAARIRALKHTEASLLFDSGDLIKSGNLAIPLKPEAAWGLMADAGCDAGTLGNRESHILESAFQAKLAGSAYPLVCGNMFRRDGSQVFPSSIVLDCGGWKVGVLGVMVPMVTRRMATQVASAFLWEAPIPIAIETAKALRPNCELVIALTHIGFPEDQRLAEAGPEIDLILGGHSHNVLEEPVKFGKTWICQSGSHGRFVGRYEWDGQLVDAKLLPLKSSD